MHDDVGTSCATTNATPGTSLAPRMVWMPQWPGPETAEADAADAFMTSERGPDAPGHTPSRVGEEQLV